MSNLAMIKNIGEYVYELYANTMPFYIRHMSCQAFWYSQGDLELISQEN